MHILHVCTAAADAESRHKKSIIAHLEESDQHVQAYFTFFCKNLPRNVMFNLSKQHMLR